MSGELSIPIALVLGIVIIVVEIARPHPPERVDFLLTVNLAFFVFHCFIPMCLWFKHFSIQKLVWTQEIPFESPAFVFASLVTLIGYLVLLLGYFFRDSILNFGSRSQAEMSTTPTTLSYKHAFLMALTFGAIGCLAMVVYAQSIGGFYNMLTLGSLYRSGFGPIKSNLAFLKNIMPMVFVSSFMFFSLIIVSKKIDAKALAVILFMITFSVSIMALFHQSGRLNMIAYLFIFPLFLMIYKKTIKMTYIFFGVTVFGLMAILGDALFAFFFDNDLFQRTTSNLSSQPSDALLSLLRELSFPYLTLSNAVRLIPDIEPLRWFIDVPTAIFFLLPKRMLGFTAEQIPETVSTYNTGLIGSWMGPNAGQIPVDIVSFGYFSFGLTGVLLICFCFGLLLSYCEKKTSGPIHPVIMTFRAALIMYVAFRVPYGDPQIALKDGFCLLLALIVLAMLTRSKPVAADLPRRKASLQEGVTQ